MRGLRARRVILCLAVGVVATYASAWLSFATSQSLTLIANPQKAGKAEWMFVAPEGTPEPIGSGVTTITGAEFRYEQWNDDGLVFVPIAPSMPERMLVANRHRYGWPTLAIETRHWDAYLDTALGIRDEDPRYELSVFSTGVRVGSGPRRAPLRPVWPGFLINTLLYAGAAWLLLALPEGWRIARGRSVWQRRRRGLCPACGYDLSGLTACPECGA